MLVWFRADHPAAPAPATDASGELKHGNPAMQPRPAPPKPRTAPAADDAATAEDPADAAARKRAARRAGRQAGGRRRGAALAAGRAAMNGESRLRMLLTALVALMLTVLPLPPWLDVLRPIFLVLMVLYWSMNAPRTGGMALGFFAGLALDVFQGSVLGEHALALALVTYLAVREHQLIRSKPAIQQSLFVLLALVALRAGAVHDRRLDRPSGHEPAALGAHAHRRTDLAAGGGAVRLRCGPARVRELSMPRRF